MIIHYQREQMRRTALVVTAAAAMAAAGVGTAAAAEPRILVVDRDRAQCPQAGFGSIQAAVDAARPGDRVRVCPDRYPERVTVDKPLTLWGVPEAVQAVDCFQPSLAALPVDRLAVVDPPGDGFSVAFRLRADDVALAGFVVQGASVGIDASDGFSGYRVHHNLIRLQTRFGMDFGSRGDHRSRVDHNCLRENQFGLVSELDDDSLWKPSDGPERDEWNARELINARIDHNDTFRNRGAFSEAGAGLEAAGPGRRGQVTFEHNLSREDSVGLLLQNATDSAIIHNDVRDAAMNALQIGGGNQRLIVASNHVGGAGLAGIRFASGTFIDHFPASTAVTVAKNEIKGGASGILIAAANLTGSLVAENTTTDSRGNGIAILSGNTGNQVRANRADNNGVSGISAFAGATANRFERNSMHGNGRIAGTQGGGADGRDFNTPLNIWIDNDCDTDIPADLICVR